MTEKFMKGFGGRGPRLREGNTMMFTAAAADTGNSNDPPKNPEAARYRGMAAMSHAGTGSGGGNYCGEGHWHARRSPSTALLATGIL